MGQDYIKNPKIGKKIHLESNNNWYGNKQLYLESNLNTLRRIENIYTNKQKLKQIQFFCVCQCTTLVRSG